MWNIYGGGSSVKCRAVCLAQNADFSARFTTHFRCITRREPGRVNHTARMLQRLAFRSCVVAIMASLLQFPLLLLLLLLLQSWTRI